MGMNLNQPTLIEFENERAIFEYIPPDQSNSFYRIGTDLTAASIDIYTIGNTISMTVDSGILNTGEGTFEFSTSDVYGVKYVGALVKLDASIAINENLVVDGSILTIFGTLILEENASLNVINGGSIKFERNSKFVINENASISIDDTSIISVLGTMDIDVDLISTVINTPNMEIDPSVVIEPMNVDLGDRIFSMTDYDAYLRWQQLNTYTIGEYNIPNGRLGYQWKDGSLAIGSQQLELSVTFGSAILGDFKLSVLGKQSKAIPNLQVIQSVHIVKDTTLYIADEYEGFPYLMPELYAGIIPSEDGSINTPGVITVDGTIIVDGAVSKITMDQSAKLIINETGTVKVQNSASIINCESNGDDQILIINGKLILDNIQQIETFNVSNIEFGENGKVIILNPSEEDHILFNIPDDDHVTELYTHIYRLFGDRIDKLEYHLSPHTGIKIDRTCQYYNVELREWYGGMRIEKAVHDGLIIWESGAYMELDNDIISWATLQSTLYDASKLFKAYASIDSARLIEVANRLKYAGFGNVRFRFRQGDTYNDITMVLVPINLKSVTSTPNSTEYSVNVDNNGNMFIRNQVSNPDPENIISNESKGYALIEGDNSFSL